MVGRAPPELRGATLSHLGQEVHAVYLALTPQIHDGLAA